MSHYVDILSQRLRNLPALPGVLTQLNSLLASKSVASESVAIDDLVKILKTDGGLSIRLLRVANSPFYAPKKPVVDLAQAAVLLGVSEIANMARCLAMIDVTGKMQAWQVLDATQYWQSSLAISALTKVLAKHINFDQNADFEACLFNIGLCVLADSFPEKYTQVLTEKNVLEVAEQALFTLDNIQAKRLLLTKWQIANVDGSAQAAGADSATVDGLIDVASRLTAMFGYAPCARYSFLDDPYQLLASIGVDKSQVDRCLPAFAEAVSAGAHNAGGVFGINEQLDQALASIKQRPKVYIDTEFPQLREALVFLFQSMAIELVASIESCDILIGTYIDNSIIATGKVNIEERNVINLFDCILLTESDSTELIFSDSDTSTLNKTQLAINWTVANNIIRQQLYCWLETFQSNSKVS